MKQTTSAACDKASANASQVKYSNKRENGICMVGMRYGQWPGRKHSLARPHIPNRCNVRKPATRHDLRICGLPSTSQTPQQQQRAQSREVEATSSEVSTPRFALLYIAKRSQTLRRLGMQRPGRRTPTSIPHNTCSMTKQPKSAQQQNRLSAIRETKIVVQHQGSSINLSASNGGQLQKRTRHCEDERP